MSKNITLGTIALTLAFSTGCGTTEERIARRCAEIENGEAVYTHPAQQSLCASQKAKVAKAR